MTAGNWNTPDSRTHLNYTGIGERASSLLGSMTLQCRACPLPHIHQCVLTRLKLLSSPRCPTLVQKSEEVLYHGAATFPRNTACIHLTPPCSPEKPYLQENNSQPHSHIVKNQPALQLQKPTLISAFQMQAGQVHK